MVSCAAWIAALVRDQLGSENHRKRHEHQSCQFVQTRSVVAVLFSFVALRLRASALGLETCDLRPTSRSMYLVSNG